MKKLQYYLFPLVLLAAMVYLTGCLCALSFNLFNWSEDIRGFLGGFFLSSAIVLEVLLFLVWNQGDN